MPANRVKTLHVPFGTRRFVGAIEEFITVAPGAELVVTGVVAGTIELGARALLTVVGVSSAAIIGGPDCKVRLSGVVTGSFDLVDSVVEVSAGSLITSGGAVWEVGADGTLSAAERNYETYTQDGSGPWFVWGDIDADGRFAMAPRR